MTKANRQKIPEERNQASLTQQTTPYNNRELLGTKTGILDQARLRPHRTSLGPSAEGKITTTLFELKCSGLAESTVKHVFGHLSYLARHCNLDNPDEVAGFVANMKGSDSYKSTFVKSYSHCAQLNGLSWVKPTFK